MITNPAFSSLLDNHIKSDKAKRIGSVYNGYRILISIFFSTSFIFALITSQHDLILWINILPTFGYFIFSVLGFFIYRLYPKNNLLMIGLVVDAVVLTIMLYFSGGADLQIILLFLVEVAASFMLVRTNQAILLTLFALALIIYQQFFHSLKNEMNYTMLNNGALITLSFLGVAYFSYTLSKRLKQIETLSERQSNEVNALNAINKKIVTIIDQGVLVVSHKLELLIANDTALEQLQIPQQLDDFTLSTLSPSLAEHLRPIITQYEKTITFRLDTTPLHTPNEPNHPINYASFNEFRLRVTQLNQNYALVFIEDLRRELSRAQQLKLASLGQLTASIAHEIRNPLATISQASQLLAEDAQDPKSTLSDDNIMLYDMIYKQTKRVNQIIEDVLKLSRQQRPTQVLINPKTWLTEFLKENFASHDIFLHCHTHQGFLFDHCQLEQILTNLINNGLRFSSKSHPHAFVTLEVYEAGKFLHIDVLDTGKGVAAENIQFLFNPFFTTDHQGTGLGLYLSQAFCQANHASLEYVPNFEQTCFRIVCIAKQLPSI